MPGVVTLEEITEDTLDAVLELDVSVEQRKFVAQNAVSIARAHFSHYAWLRAIYNDETPVGFCLLYLDADVTEYSIWELMIDRSHQGKGYGSAALDLIIEFVRSLPEADELLVRYLPGQGNPAEFFKKRGFADTESSAGKHTLRMTLYEEPFPPLRPRYHPTRAQPRPYEDSRRPLPLRIERPRR